MDIVLTPISATGETTEQTTWVFAPYRFTVVFEHETGSIKMGMEQVSVYFHAGKKTGRLQLIRAEGKGKEIQYNDTATGGGIKRVLREYEFESWAIEEGSIRFKDCETK